MGQEKNGVHVFVNKRAIDFASDHAKGTEILAAAGFIGQEWDLLQLQGEGDPSGGTLIPAAQTVILKNGDHFRVIPGNRTFGG